MAMFEGRGLPMKILEECDSGQVLFPQSWQASVRVPRRHDVAADGTGAGEF